MTPASKRPGSKRIPVEKRAAPASDFSRANAAALKNELEKLQTENAKLFEALGLAESDAKAAADKRDGYQALARDIVKEHNTIIRTVLEALTEIAHAGVFAKPRAMARQALVDLSELEDGFELISRLSGIALHERHDS